MYIPKDFPHPGDDLAAVRDQMLFWCLKDQKGICPICEQKLSGSIDLHEAIVTRGDVQGWPKSWRIIIQNPYNCVMVHRACHKHGDRQKFWDYKCKMYGKAEMEKWYYSLPFKGEQRRFE